MRPNSRILILLFALWPPAIAEELDALEFLPPPPPWDGGSRSLVVSADHEWVTPSERSGLTATPRYEETVSWLKRLCAAAPELEMRSIGASPEGREIWMVIATSEGAFSRQALARGGKPILLAQAGIHSGEIDGKDAGLMLLRDMTVRGNRRDLLGAVNFLFVPILSVDAHERFSRFSRINQRGPVEMGWRTNARNLNLNRDYTKLETDEVRAMVRVINEWKPDLYLDLHVTDGVDYQYDVTWGAAPSFGWSPEISRWLAGPFGSFVNREMERGGHVPGPFAWALNGRDLSEGSVVWMGTPRFSDSYGSVRHLPTILVENHSLKPYDQRVLGTYLFLEATMRFLGEHVTELRKAVAKDSARRPSPLTLDWKMADPPIVEERAFRGVRVEVEDSPISGAPVARWTGEPVEMTVPYHVRSAPSITVDRPDHYYIPAGWAGIADKLELHGIEVERISAATSVSVTMYRLPDAELDTGENGAFDQNAAVYEGRVRVKPGTLVREQRELKLLPGSVRVSTDQPLGDLAMFLLEPESPDSLFQWGFFLEMLSRTEYVEAYVMEPMAKKMMEDDPALARAFEAKLEADADFAADPKARLQWFYEKTPYFDPRYRLYPVARGR